jgi:hypothetical protein
MYFIRSTITGSGINDWYSTTAPISITSITSATSATSATNSVYQIWARQQWLQSQTATTTIWSTWSTGYLDEERRQWEHEQERQTLLYRQPHYGELARVEPPPRPHDEHALLRDRLRRERAEERADELLMSLLSPDQLRQYQAAKAFEVCTKAGRRYRLTRQISGSVKLLGPDGRAMATYCAHLADHRIPIPDHLIAQKFLLEHHEEEFLRVANRS